MDKFTLKVDMFRENLSNWKKRKRKVKQLEIQLQK